MSGLLREDSPIEATHPERGSVQMIPPVDPFSFWLGIAVAGVVGFLAFRFGVWWGTVSMMWQKQVVKHTTDKTPLQIVLESLRNIVVAIVIVIIGFILFRLLIANK
jgi:hypothetical protein